MLRNEKRYNDKMVRSWAGDGNVISAHVVNEILDDKERLRTQVADSLELARCALTNLQNYINCFSVQVPVHPFIKIVKMQIEWTIKALEQKHDLGRDSEA